MVSVKKYRGELKTSGLSLPEMIFDALNHYAEKYGVKRADAITFLLAKQMGAEQFVFHSGDEKTEEAAETMLKFFTPADLAAKLPPYERPKRKKAWVKQHEKPGRPKKV